MTGSVAEAKGGHARDAGDVERHFVVRASCSGVGLAFPLDSVEHVSFLVAVQPVPDGPDYLAGLTRFRGEAVPVIDLAGRLGLPPAERYQADTPVLWCRSGGRITGLIVDEVPGVAEVTRDGLQMTDAFEAGRPPLAGVVHHEGAMWLLVEVSTVLDFDYAQAVTDLEWDEEAIRHWVQEDTRQGGTVDG
ncbi:MAG TPA: chemotaxis protein CheW [Gammaproteobacteria bacterium]|nr:chemotaxis protein CheW [Gammaproteobacteria bacterium]